MSEHSAELWERAQAILGDALERRGRDREEFIEDACAGDPALLAEVRSLVSASDEAGGFFDGLADALAEAADRSSGERDSLVGTEVGHFQVTGVLGRGGMGEVYRAIDGRLGREVALKTLPADLAGDMGHVVRFRREARVVASIRHPNIADIYGVEEIDGRTFLVLELVEGPTLKDRLDEGDLHVLEALDIARQVAEALEAAHDMGIVHRDLKPANVKLSPGGRVRVLDFGIAKSDDEIRTPGASVELSPRTPVDVTRPGMILGTASYMSPEQARGKPIDARSDVWAFGALLFELLTGRRAFDGEDATQVVARILEAEPDWSTLPEETPAEVRRLLERCLERDVRRRLQAVGEARIVLEDSLSGDGPSSAGLQARPAEAGRGNPWKVAAAVGAGLVVGALAVLLLRPSAGGERTARTFRLAVAENAAAPVLAPTGDRVSFVSDAEPWVVFFDGSSPRRLEAARDGYGFFWSPDGEDLGFARDETIWRISSGGGEATPVGRLEAVGFAGAAWREDGTIVVSTSRGLMAFPEFGGEPEVLWMPPDSARAAPRSLTFAPDGTLYGVVAARSVVVFREGALHEIYRTEEGIVTGLTYASPAHLLFSRRDADPGIWALPVESDGRVAGAPFLVSAAQEPPSASRDGHVAWLDRRTSRQLRHFAWVDRSGRTVGIVGDPQPMLEQFDVSPSGRQVVAVAEEGGRRRLWIHSLESGERFALSPMPHAGARWPRWAPDEDRIVYRYDGPDGQSFAIKSVEPGVPPEHLGLGIYPSFAPDGVVLFSFGGDIYRVRPGTSGEPEPFVQSPGSQSEPRVSVTGLVAFSGQTPEGEEIFVTPYPDGGPSWQVSTNGGERAKWRGDGRELFYLADGRLMAVDVAFDGTEPRFGRPKPLFSFPDVGVWSLNYDPAPDGQRFLTLRAMPRRDIEDVDAIVLLQDWAARFTR